MANSGIPLGKWSGSDSTDALHETIIKYGRETSRQTQTMIRLTYAIAFLTFVMLVGLGVQIYLAFYPITSD